MRKVLIIQTAFLGDVILATALVETIKKCYPKTKIDFMVRNGNASILSGNPHINNILVWNKKKKYTDLFRLLHIVRNEKYDKVINLQRYFTMAFFTIFSKAKVTYGFRSSILSLFFSKSMKYSFKNRHELEKNHSLIKSFTVNNYEKPKLYGNEDKKILAEKYVTPCFLTISPGSVWCTKTYPVKKWVSFLMKIRKPYIVYILGSEKEFLLGEIIRESVLENFFLKVINLSGKLDILSSGFLMQKAQMNYALDSAPTHVAGAFNAPIATIFSSTDPIFGFAPVSDKAFIIQTKKKLSCKPCTVHGKIKCPFGHYDCAFTVRDEQLLSLLP